MLNCFSIDVEGFCQGSAESFYVDPNEIGSKRERYEIEKNVEDCLEFLEQEQIKATFFTLGVIAKNQPQLLRKIAAAGHEIGSHSFNHLRLFSQSKEVAREAIFSSKKVLEDASGNRVFGFRAPEFSINRETMYLIDYIQQAGYIYDSSIFPICGHDVYGVPGAKRQIHLRENGLIEFPPSTFDFFGKILPALGGGYLRIYPFLLSRLIFKKLNDAKMPAMCYIHPYELGNVLPKIENIPFLKKLRRYSNISQTKPRFKKLLSDYKFAPAIDVLVEQNFVNRDSLNSSTTQFIATS